MIYILTGSDDFSKKEFVSELQKKENSEQVSFFEHEDKEILNAALNNSLFGGKKLLKIYDYISKADPEKLWLLLEKLIPSSSTVIFFEQKLDKRKSDTKKLLSDKRLEVKEFEAPQAPEFTKWVEQRAKKYDFSFNKGALDTFIQRLAIDAGDFGGESFDLWQADSELQKLGIFASGKEISVEEVKALVAENPDDNIFKITNAIGDKDKALATKYLMDYMDKFGDTDEKTKIIGLSGLLADQFRGILLIQELTNRRATPEEIAEQTGFSSGRVFVFKKLAQRFTQQKVLEALKKLELLDQEIKTTQGPAALQFFMIIDSVMK